MKSLFAAAAVGAAILGFAGTANAAETLKINSVTTVYDYSVQGTTAYRADLNAPGTKNDATNALLSPQTINGTLKAFCVDLAQTSHTGTFDVIPLGKYLQDLGKSSVAGSIAALVSNYGMTNNVLTDSAVQLAIWELLYEDGNSFNVTKGGFKSSDAEKSVWSKSWTNKWSYDWKDDSAVQIEANRLLGTLGSISDTGGYDFFVAKSGKYQDLLYFQPKAAVPEPATWALMIMGFGLVGASMRRRAARTTVSFA